MFVLCARHGVVHGMVWHKMQATTVLLVVVLSLTRPPSAGLGQRSRAVVAKTVSLADWLIASAVAAWWWRWWCVARVCGRVLSSLLLLTINQERGGVVVGRHLWRMGLAATPGVGFVKLPTVRHSILVSEHVSWLVGWLVGW